MRLTLLIKEVSCTWETTRQRAAARAVCDLHWSTEIDLRSDRVDNSRDRTGAAAGSSPVYPMFCKAANGFNVSVGHCSMLQRTQTRSCNFLMLARSSTCPVKYFYLQCFLLILPSKVLLQRRDVSDVSRFPAITRRHTFSSTSQTISLLRTEISC